MTRPLRQRHRITICLLAVLLPLAFAMGMIVRRPVPVTVNLPPELRGQLPEDGTWVWERTDLWPGQPSRTAVRRSARGTQVLELDLPGVLQADVLVYWVPGARVAEGGLPDRALLLGPLTPGVMLAWPTQAAGEPGHLWLYSLAEHEMVTASHMLPLPRR